MLLIMSSRVKDSCGLVSWKGLFDSSLGNLPKELVSCCAFCRGLHGGLAIIPALSRAVSALGFTAAASCIDRRTLLFELHEPIGGPVHHCRPT